MFDFHYQLNGARRKAFRVKGDVCCIGSARNNDLVVNARTVGKRHAELRLKTDGVYIRDLGSLGGCWVNSERVMEYGPLGGLDEVTVGEMIITLNIQSIERDNDAVNDPMLAAYEASTVQGGARAAAAVDSTVGSDQAHSELTVVPAAEPVESVQKPAKRGLFGKLGFGSGSKGEDNPAESAVITPTEVQTPTGLDSDASVDASRAAPKIDTNVVSLSVVEDVGDQTGEPTNKWAAHDVVSTVEQRDTEQEKLDEQYAYWASIVHEQLLYQMDLRRKDVNRMSDEELRSESSIIIDNIITKLATQIPPEIEQIELQQNVLNEAVGLGPLQQFLDDEEVTEIMVNNFEEIFVERAGKLERSRSRFSSDRTVSAVIERIITPLGRRIDESSPIVDARLKDGSRVNAVIPPLALKGPSMTIRKFPKHRLQFSDLLKYGSTSEAMVEFLRVCVEMRKNIVVAGGTGSGKTTLLNVLSNFIPASDRVVTIEDAAELKLVQPNLVSLEARPPNLEGKGAVPIRDLVKNSLRMRPDRIVVGECRGGEALDMLQAMNTGHDGSLTTIHANSPRDVISRLEVLVLMAGMELPVSAIREQVASAVDMIIQQTRFHCGSRKITRVTEVVGVESGTVQLQDIFVFDQSGVDENGRVEGGFRATGAIPTFYEELRSIGIEVNLDAFAEGARV